MLKDEPPTHSDASGRSAFPNIMVKLGVLRTCLAFLYLAALPTFGQRTAGGPSEQCPVCTTVANRISVSGWKFCILGLTLINDFQDCRTTDTNCLCSPQIISGVSACNTCVDRLDVDTSDIHGWNAVEGRPLLLVAMKSVDKYPTEYDEDMCDDLNAPTTVRASAAATTLRPTTTSRFATAPTVITTPASTVTPPPLGKKNGAMALDGGVRISGVMLALVLGIAG